MRDEIVDEEMLQEAVLECNELLEECVLELFQIEKENYTFSKERYNSLFRRLHSVKGGLAMVGMKEHSQIVHQFEATFIKCLELNQFSKEVVDTLIDGISNFQRILSLPLDPVKDTCYSPKGENSTESSCFLSKDLVWRDEYLTGCSVIDSEHRHIFEVLRNVILNFNKKGQCPHELAFSLSEVLDLLKTHFEGEDAEKKLCSLSEELKESHQLQHRKFLEILGEYQDDLVNLNVNPSLSILLGLTFDMIDHLVYEVNLFRENARN